ncbi:MAG: glycosyltransferase family 2 protein [Planctomycetaceae bacterium]|nr:glycosyltransferase family 2 protein [Planctomycetaceae bacterium]
MTRSRPTWAVGITTAPRPVPMLKHCVASTLATGWLPDELTVFADNNADLHGVPVDVRIVRRPQTIAPNRFEITGSKFGAWANFVQTLADLRALHPEADTIFTIQDDVTFCAGLRKFLDDDLWPSSNVGLVSPYCPNARGDDNRGVYIDDRTIGCRRIKHRYLIAGQTYIFPRHVVDQILDHPLSTHWRGRFKGQVTDITDKKALDAYVGEVTRRLGLRRYFYNPSLAQHEEPPGRQRSNSSLKGHGRHLGFRRAGRFIGHETPAAAAFVGHEPHLRYDQPSGDQRFRTPRPDVTHARLSVVIPAIDGVDLTERCLQHLAQQRGDLRLQIIYIDNGSQPGVIDQVRQIARQHGLPLQVIANPTNVGYTRAINQGLEAAAGEHVLLLNNDCFVGPNCLQRLYKHLLWHPRTAAVGPLTGDHGHNSLRHRHRRQQAGMHIKRITGHWNEAHVGARLCQREFIVSEKVLPFFCTLLHRDAIAEVGLLDEAFTSGLAADDDWCLRAGRLGWQCLVACDAFAAHLHQTTFRRQHLQRSKLLAAAHRQLRIKHPPRR